MPRTTSCLPGVCLMLMSATYVAAEEVGRGYVLFEYWNSCVNTSRWGGEVFVRDPDSSEWRPGLTGPADRRDICAQQARAFLSPPANGEYTFWISDDDESKLWLSTDDDPANSHLIASVSGWTSSRDSNKSAPISLQAGRIYFIMAQQKGGSDGIAVTWAGPVVGYSPVTICRYYLTAYIRDPEPLLFTARNPEPADGATDVGSPTYTWEPGMTAQTHNVYFGMNPTPGPGEFRGGQTSTTYTHSEPLELGARYYWRVDEIDAAGNTYPGAVWSFTALPLEGRCPDTYETIQILNGKIGPVDMAFGATGKAVLLYDNAIYIHDLTTSMVQKISRGCDRVVLHGANHSGKILWSEMNSSQQTLVLFTSGTNSYEGLGNAKFSPGLSDNGCVAWLGADNDIYVRHSSSYTHRVTNDGTPKSGLRINALGDLVWVALGNIYLYRTWDSSTTQITEHPVTDLTPELSDQGIAPAIVWEDHPPQTDRGLMYRIRPSQRGLADLSVPNRNNYDGQINGIGDIIWEGNEGYSEDWNGPPPRFDIFLRKYWADTTIQVSEEDRLNLWPSLNNFCDVAYVSLDESQCGGWLRLYEAASDSTRTITHSTDQVYRVILQKEGHDILWETGTPGTNGAPSPATSSVYLSRRLYSPSANAGPSQYGKVGTTVTLDGSMTSDPDNTLDQLVFGWTQIEGASVALVGANTATASFTAPAFPQTLAFRLVVTDSCGHASSDGTQVYIWDLSNPDADADGDGLPNRWETEGVDTNGDGIIDLDLPAMGASPLHKDIFVEVDYEQIDENHTHKFLADAVEDAIWTFIDAPVPNPDGRSGIKIHIDAGPDTIMNPADDFAPGDTWGTGQTWGELSRSNAIAENPDGFGAGTYTILALQQTRQQNIGAGRNLIFHYALCVHALANLPTAGGVAFGRNFIITTDAPANGLTAFYQAASFVHELGHTLGLDHGGNEEYNYKPNYLSVMNYMFCNGLLYAPGASGKSIDYSSVALPALIESNLNERIGLNGPSDIERYVTDWWCPNGGLNGSYRVNDWLDWNCDGLHEREVSADINQDGELTALNGFDDWANLPFSPVSGGLLYATADEPEPDLPIDELSKLPVFAGVDVELRGPDAVPPGDTATFQFTVRNVGSQAREFRLLAFSSQKDWADLSSIPKNLTISAGEKMVITVPVKVPAAAKLGDVEMLTLRAYSPIDWQIRDVAEARLRIASARASWPRARAGGLIIADAGLQAGAWVTLDGSGSYHPEAEQLTYTWTGPGINAVGISPKVWIPLGTHLVTLRVSDSHGRADIDHLVVKVERSGK